MNEFDPLRSTNMFLEHTDEWIYCHENSVCKDDYCTLHNRSNHSMRSFRQHWRSDRAIMERICMHGVGHPDPDEYRVRVGLDDGSHGCDTCCRSIEEIIEAANQVRIELYEEGLNENRSL